MKNPITIFFLLIITVVNYSQIPRIISYQGVLTDISGNIKPDGNYDFIFTLYDSQAGGNALWSENKSLNVSKGIFSTSLGDQTPFGVNVKFDKPYWLGIKVGSDAELTPRIALTSAGYSINSATAQDVAGGKVVKSVNGLKDKITITGGGGTTVNSSNNQIIISSSGSGGSGMQGIQNTDNTIEITNPNGPTATVNLKLPMSLSNNNGSYIFSSLNNGNGGSIYGYTAQGGYGVRGESPSGTGLLGVSTSATGILGTSSTGTAINDLVFPEGVYGEAANPGRGFTVLVKVRQGQLEKVIHLTEYLEFHIHQQVSEHLVIMMPADGEFTVTHQTAPKLWETVMPGSAFTDTVTVMQALMVKVKILTEYMVLLILQAVPEFRDIILQEDSLFMENQP